MQPEMAFMTIVAGSASSSAMAADFPPSSSWTFLMVCAASAPTRRPAGTLPVKLTMSTSGFDTSSSPTSTPPPPITFTTPGGISASSAARAISNASRGVHGAAFGDGETRPRPLVERPASSFYSANRVLRVGHGGPGDRLLGGRVQDVDTFVAAGLHPLAADEEPFDVPGHGYFCFRSPVSRPNSESRARSGRTGNRYACTFASALPTR